jgi:two-component system OmpR family sensor kinase
VSLRLRLSLLALSVLLALLLVGGAVQYLFLGRTLRAEEASLLNRSSQQDVARLAVAGRLCQRTGQKLVQGTSINPVVASCIAAAFSNSLPSRRVTTGIIDRAGVLVASSPPETDVPQLAADEYTAALGRAPKSYYLTGSGSTEQLVVVRPLPPNSRTEAVALVQLSVSTASIQAAQQSSLLILAIAFGVLMLAAAVVVPLLVGRALRPLHRVTEASVAIAGGDLSRRVSASRSSDELGTLARAFNEMAAAVQRAFNIRTESEANIRNFAGDASHELRTPLTTIQGRLDVLMRGAADDPGVLRSSLEAMQREVRRMSGLVEDLLTLTRLDSAAAAGGRDSPREPVDVDGLVAETVEELSVRAPGQEIRVEPSAGGPPLVMGDREQLRRIVLNLANNAINYAPGGTHTWRTRVEDGQVVLSLEDNGPGIQPDDRGRVFNRFYRGSAGGRAAAGSGLGLPIVKSIAESHGGGVEATGAAGGGAIFTVRLPRAQDA